MASSSGSSYASSEERTNYARMCNIVVVVFRDILWQVLTNEILPADLPKKVQIDIKKLGYLNLKIKTWLCGISPPSTEIPIAEKFDVSSLYSLIRNFCKVPTPSKKWGETPHAGDKTLGDDVERVRDFRNTIYGHATETKIETPDFNKLCIEIKNVVSRFDAHFCSLPKAMKHDFECEIDTIRTCPMDKSLEDYYIDKMKEIAVLDCVVDVQQKLGDLTKTVYNVEDVVHDLQKDGKENAEDSRNRLCRIQETLDMLHMEKGKFEKDKVEDTTYSLVNEERDCNENAGISHEDIALEMPQGMEGTICIIKCYVDLKLELERDIVIDIAKELFQKKKHKDVLEDLHQAGTRRLCIDRFLKRVLKLEASGLKIFFDLLKRKCPEIAQKLAEIKVTDKDREDFTQVSESVQEVPHRIQNGLKFEPLDVKFFQWHFQDIPEKVDYRADVLLSQFRISICDHSQLIKENDPVKKIHALLEKIQSCPFDSDSEVESLLGSKLYQKWQSFRDDGSRQGLENQGIWHYIQERIQSSKEYVITLFRGLGLLFMQANRGSLVLKFVTLDNFDVKLLKPEAVKTKLWDMIKTLCPEYQDVFTEPVHLTIFSKPLSNTDSAEIHFYLESRKEKEEFSCMKLGSHDKQYIVEEMGPVSLTNWMCNTQLDEDTKTKLVDTVSRKDMSRRKKMKILLNIVESLGNGYELLEKYCEEYDTFLYNEVFKKHREMMVEENPDGVQQYEFSKEGLQRLSSTWIDFTVDPKGKEEDRTCSVEKDTKEMTSFFENDTPHGLVKRHIFRRHCEAFVAKTQNSKLQTIIYDAFAGAGYYSDGLPTEEERYGSPLICLDVVIKYFQRKSNGMSEKTRCRQEFQDTIKYIEEDIQMPELENRVILNFSEADKGNCLKLVKNIVIFVQNTIGDNFTTTFNTDGVITITSHNEKFPICINIANTEFIHVRPPEDKQHRRLLTFIDPFSYRQIPMKHVQGFIGEHREAFINFMSSYVNRFKNVKKNETTICELYGFSDEEKKECLEELLVTSDNDYDGINRCLQMYETKLKERAGSRYILSFTFRNKKNIRLYHLIFMTKHIEGFKAMKEAMNEGSQDAGSLSMSDYYVEKNGMQLSLRNKQDSRVVAAKIFERFQGQKQVKIKDIEKFIWFETPYVWRKKPLKILQKEPEDRPRLTTVEDEKGNKPSRKYTYPDGTEWLLTFRTQSDEESLAALQKLTLQ